MAKVMNRARLVSTANQANLLREGVHSMLSAGEAMAVFENITAALGKEWLSVMRRAGVSTADHEAIRGAFLYNGLFCEEKA